jgi:hypothetical protein
MTDRPPVETEAAPAGEHIHLPAPSILPLINAAGLAVGIVGITEGLPFLVGGLTVFVVTTIIWIRSVVTEVNELPLEHH